MNVKRALLFLALAGFSGAFAVWFFPWPLWLACWLLFLAVAAASILFPDKPGERPGLIGKSSKAADQPSGKDPFEAFDDHIKWDKFK